MLEDATVQADAPDREPHASGTHGEPDAGTSQMAGGFTHSIIEDIRGLDDKARAVLFDALLPGEHPHVVIAGEGGSAIVATGERVLVIKTGARSGALLGARAKAFEYESVIGVRLDTDRDSGVVAVDAPVKIASCRVYWADSRDNAWKARNAIPVERPFGPVQQAVDAIRGLLEAFRDRHPGLGAGTPAAPPPPPRHVEALPDTEPASEQDDEGAVVSPLPVLGERCPRCRADVRPGWRFCPKCGAASENATRTPLG
jgi:hypothetical protein